MAADPSTMPSRDQLGSGGMTLGSLESNVPRMTRCSRVRDENGLREEHKERPDPDRFRKAGLAPLLHFPASLD